jgi:hypothetical protein
MLVAVSSEDMKNPPETAEAAELSASDSIVYIELFEPIVESRLWERFSYGPISADCCAVKEIT